MHHLIIGEPFAARSTLNLGQVSTESSSPSNLSSGTMSHHTPSDINAVAPTSIAHIIGQKGVVDQVTVALDAAFQDTRRFDHSLLVGPPGVGKSALAAVIAQEMATDFFEVLGQSLANVGELNGLLLRATDGAVVHIDECHEMPRPIQTALYLATDKRRVFVSGARSVQSIPIHDFTLLLSTTDEYCLLNGWRTAGGWRCGSSSTRRRNW